MCKLLGQAGQKEYTEQQNLLANQEFRRLNVRVPATLDQPVQEQRKNPKKLENDEEQLEAMHAANRHKFKIDSNNRIAERESPRRGDRDQDRRERDNAREQGDVGGPSEADGKGAGEGGQRQRQGSLQLPAVEAVMTGKRRKSNTASGAHATTVRRSSPGRAMSARGRPMGPI